MLKDGGASSGSLSGKAMFYMILLSLQFGVQPILTRQYTAPNIIKSTVVLTQEVVKFIMAYSMLSFSGGEADAVKGWTFTTWLSVALLPAGLYAVQNMASLTAYQNLDALTYNTLNQTKTLSAALNCYLIIGRKQSTIQIFALMLLLLSALIMEGIVSVNALRMMLLQSHPTKVFWSNVSSVDWGSKHFMNGVLPILLASYLSGLAGALSQKKLQAVGGGRDAYLFTMELCAASCVILLISLVISSDGEKILLHGFWDGWTIFTFIPIVTNSAGGIIVGLVTKYAGSVRKGFALIFGILISGIIQSMVHSEKEISNEQILGGSIAALSLYLHAANPSMMRRVKQE